VLPPGGVDQGDCLPLSTAGIPRLVANRTSNVSATAAIGTITTAAGSVGNGLGNSLGQVPMNVAYVPPDPQYPKGVLYISDWAFYNVVRRLDLFTGQETVVAGNGGTGFNGDGAATSVELNSPWGVAVDNGGNVYVAGGRRVRRLDPSGQLLTVVDDNTLLASGIPPAPGGGGVYSPTGLAMDNQGNLLIADWAGERILKFDPMSGLVTVVAGTGYFGYNGDNQPATSATLALPQGVAVDAVGNIYIADMSNQRIRKVDVGGIITTIVGDGTFEDSGDGGPAIAARITNPSQLSFDAAGNLYTITGYGRVRKIDTSGIITTVAGGGSTIPADGVPALSARFNTPAYGVTAAPDGTLFIADTNGSHVWEVDSAGPAQGLLHSVAGNGTLGESGDGGPANLAQIFQADNVVFDSAGNYYVADWVMSVVRKVKPDGTITSVAGLVGGNQYSPTGYRGYNGDNIPATQAKLHSPTGMAVDAVGNLYIADSFANRIRMVDTNGIIHTVAGTGTAGYSGDGGPATMAQLYEPNGVAVDSKGNIYIADSGTNAFNGNRIRKVAPDGTITTVAGNGIGGYNGDGIPAIVAQVNGPYGLAVDTSDNLYVADTFNSRVRKIDMNSVVPIISTVAGNGTAGFSGDGGPALVAQLYYPSGVSVDTKGDIAIADPNYSVQRLRMVDTSGTINTIAGNGTAGLSGDGGPATQAMLAYPGGVAFDLVGNVFIADGFYPFGNNRVREVYLLPPVQLNAVVSRKTHSDAGTFDVDLPLTGSTGIECRSGATGDHTLVFTFANALTNVGGASVTSGNGSVSSSNIDSTDAHNYIVNLTGVANAQVITVSLTNVNDSAGNASSAVSVSMGVLLGDVNANGVVSNTDVAEVKGQVAAPFTTSNFRNDVNANGIISNTDVSSTKAQVGTTLP
jgi:sugar lactone lactonase YvrE